MTYWVEYTYSYMFYNDAEDTWELYEDSDSHRVHCRKADIKKTIRKQLETGLQYETYKKLEIVIVDLYETTDCEV